MKLLKKPYIAVLLAIIIVLGSTSISIGSKLSNKCNKITDGFYNGVRYDGQDHPAIAGQIKELCSIADDIIIIANNYGIKTSELDSTAASLEQALSNNSRDIERISDLYDAFYSALKTTEDTLNSTGLSARHTESMQEYTSKIEAASSAIASAGYNDTVRKFLQSNDHFPTDSFAELYGISFPAYFD